MLLTNIHKRGQCTIKTSVKVQEPEILYMIQHCISDHHWDMLTSFFFFLSIQCAFFFLNLGVALNVYHLGHASLIL